MIRSCEAIRRETYDALSWNPDHWSAQAKANGIPEQEVIDKIMLAPMPKKAFITIEEIAATVEFLISHQARNITGQTIVIDGGWTAR